MPRKLPPEDAITSSERNHEGPGRGAEPARGLSDVELLAEIGRELRAVYNDLFREPVPEHLAQIIERLEGRDKDA